MILPIIGILVVGIGQWAIGGSYAIAPLFWMLIGIVAASAWAISKKNKDAVSA